MSETFRLRCSCGHLRGELRATARQGARGICHCVDCQTYARFLAPSRVVDAHGGTEVIQTWPACVTLTEGREQLRLVRLSPSGLHRFYAGCCRTPVANCFARPRMAFLGLLAGLVDPAQASALTATFGRAQGVQGRFAPGGCPPGVHPSASVGVIAGAIGLLVRGRWNGAYAPSPVLDNAGRPRVAAQVLSSAERDALRPPSR